MSAALAARTQDPRGAPSTSAGWPVQGLGLAGSGALLWAYAQATGTWALGFVVLVPWLLSLGRVHSAAGALLSGWAMSVVYVIAALHWFGAAIGAYVGLEAWMAWGLLVLLAPLLQPQILLFAWVRHLAARRHGAWWAAGIAPAAWVACEWAVPKLLGDTLGHGLQPSTALRQAADLGGAAGLSVFLLWTNGAVALAVSRRWSGWKRAAAPLAVAALIPLGMVAYGHARLAALTEQIDASVPSVRVGLVQANIVDLEARRAARGTYEAVREVLDTHVLMSEHAVQAQGAEVVVWSETIYPTTFGRPKSPDGAELDQALLDVVATLGVPLVFGTYDRDEAGEYNAAAFVDPHRGLIGHYRKTHPFPLTEWVPGWLEGPLLRRWLPWAGTWQPGDGPRSLPLVASDGRTLNLLPLICLDDVRPQLALDGVALGAEAIIGLSNDAWFTHWPQGARLHLAVASFRSVETRLPQLRVTTNGFSALIDESGEVVAQTRMDQQAVLVGEVPLRAPPLTLMRRWGDWVGRAATLLLLGWAAGSLAHRVSGGWRGAAEVSQARVLYHDPMRVQLLSTAVRTAMALLYGVSALSLAWIAWRMHVHDGWQVNALHQIQWLWGGVLAPAMLARVLGWKCRGEARIVPGLLRLEQPARSVEIPLASISALGAWRWSPAGQGVDLWLASGRRWPWGLRTDQALALHAALTAAGSRVAWHDRRSAARAERAQHRAAARQRWLDHPLIRFGLFPLLLALPAFRLHQHIAFGGTFGEWHTFGAAAWFAGLFIWWSAWILGMLLFAAVLRSAVEAVMALLQWSGVRQSGPARRLLERAARILFFVGVPLWVAVRVIGN